MSRTLPTTPNLEFLKHEAKELLQVLRQQSSDVKLADALHRLARDYGFRTWPALKAHVESLGESNDGQPVMPAISTLAGTWRIDLERSRLNALDDVRDATIAITVDGATVTMTHRQRNAEGRSDEGTTTFVADDQPHPAMGAEGDVLRARWRDGGTLETVATKDGAIVGQGVYQVSDDGRTLTISSRDARANAQGWQMADHALVLNRQ